MKDPLPPLREVVASLGLSARKSLGQNFLFDFNITRKIARAVPELAASTVMEIGPGPGGLTRALLMEGAKRVIAIEKDERFKPALEAIGAAFPGRFAPIYGDALEMDDGAVLGWAPGRVHIAANLPYNVATPLLAKWLGAEPWPPFFRSATVMVQKEVAHRLAAKSGTKAFGRLAVLCQWWAVPKILFSIPPQAFVPRPKVTSSVVHIVPASPCVERLTGPALSAFTAVLFGQRRKTLKNVLGKKFAGAAGILERENINAGLRPEALSVAEIARLAKAFSGSLRSSAS
ncbi:MAG TPA: 16S rRNA (adenine(1518)-N(6)/adenine(1519)-N(6))-dimethyltransferase RsmA [Sphingomonadales bacterium]|nr:16S rRNA (adenine(1518)-N(6)/adenine(1519)-N(6))-dimethyltransferase RsmA [Sphingomonadales bacterium]